MVRTQIYLNEQERDALRLIARQTGKTQSELIRQAIDAFIANFSSRDRLDLLREGRGLWRERDDLPDFRAVREELDRDVRDMRP